MRRISYLGERIQWIKGRWNCWWNGKHTLIGLETNLGVDAGAGVNIFEVSVVETTYCKYCKKRAIKLVESSIQKGNIPYIREQS